MTLLNHGLTRILVSFVLVVAMASNASTAIVGVSVSQTMHSEAHGGAPDDFSNTVFPPVSAESNSSSLSALTFARQAVDSYIGPIAVGGSSDSLTLKGRIYSNSFGEGYSSNQFLYNFDLTASHAYQYFSSSQSSDSSEGPLFTFYAVDGETTQALGEPFNDCSQGNICYAGRGILPAGSYKLVGVAGSSTLTDFDDHRFIFYDLSITAVPELPADYNGNHVVDAADYVLWRKTPTGYGGDDGYGAWRINFGDSAVGGLGFAAVPEPTAMMLFSTAMTALLCAAARDFRRANSSCQRTAEFCAAFSRDLGIARRTRRMLGSLLRYLPDLPDQSNFSKFAFE